MNENVIENVNIFLPEVRIQDATNKTKTWGKTKREKRKMLLRSDMSWPTEAAPHYDTTSTCYFLCITTYPIDTVNHFCIDRLKNKCFQANKFSWLYFSGHLLDINVCKTQLKGFIKGKLESECQPNEKCQVKSLWYFCYTLFKVDNQLLIKASIVLTSPVFKCNIHKSKLTVTDANVSHVFFSLKEHPSFV